jgi:hypothetical protein
MSEVTSGLISYEGTNALGRRPPRAMLEELTSCLARFGFSAEPTAVSLALDLAGDDDPELLAAHTELAREYGAYPRNLGAKSNLHLWLLFPFAEPTPAFRAYVDRLQASLPASFVTKGWRVWRFTRAGTWKANKLEPSDLPI